MFSSTKVILNIETYTFSLKDSEDHETFFLSDPKLLIGGVCILPFNMPTVFCTLYYVLQKFTLENK